MSRRHLELPPADRLAAILAVASNRVLGSGPDDAAEGTRDGAADQPGTVVRPVRDDEPLGWTPDRPGAATRHRFRDALPGPDMAAGGGRHRRAELPGPALLTVPVALRDLSARPGRLAVVGLLFVLVVAATIFGVRVTLAHAAAQPRPVVATGAQSSPLVSRSVPPGFATKAVVPGQPPVQPPGQPPVQPSPGPLPSAASILLVHVVGQVHHPGVVRLRPGDRVEDAVRAAGGSTNRADLSEINLARAVTDGEQIVVPQPGEQPTPLAGTPPVVGGAGVAGAGGSAGPPGAAMATPSPLINLNTADAAALDALPGVGPVLSQRIIEWRTEHVRFSSVEELAEVSGIGDKMLSQIRNKVTV